MPSPRRTTRRAAAAKRVPLKVAHQEGVGPTRSEPGPGPLTRSARSTEAALPNHSWKRLRAPRSDATNLFCNLGCKGLSSQLTYFASYIERRLRP